MIFKILNILLIAPVYGQGLEDRFQEVLDSGDGSGEEAAASFIQAFLNFAVPFGVFCALALLGYAAFSMITSAGNPEKLKDAKEVATNAVIGAIMIAMGVMVLSLLDSKLGIGIN